MTVVVSEKECACCGRVQPATEFYEHRRMRSGLSSYCKNCISAKGREWKEANGDRRRERSRLYNSSPSRQRAYRDWAYQRRYGITLLEYEEMLKRQGGVCAICCEKCSRNDHLAVDHDHETGRVRGLLCEKCNRGLGRFQDRPELLERGGAYLRKAVAG